MGHNQLHDLQVSPPCLGCMNFGTYTEESRSRQLLDCYIDSGGNFLDTANNYACWQPGASGDESESVLGRWMQQRNNRQRIILATKVGFNQPAIGEGLTPSIIKSEIDKSLQRLKTDYIDLYYAHNDDRSTPLEETLHTFAQLVQSGKVRYIGASNTMAWRLEQAHNISQTNKWPSYCCIQQRFTYLRPRPGAHFGPQLSANDDLLNYCASSMLPLIAYSPLLAGSYSRSDRPIPPNYRSSDTDARLKALALVARELGALPHQVVLAWMQRRRQVTIPIIAASTLQTLKENIAAGEISLSDHHMSTLNNASG